MVLTGAGGAIREGPVLLEGSFIRFLAVGFISTNLIGKIPIRSPNFPSAQLSSTLLITLMTSPFTKEIQSFSSTSVTRKSCKATH